jgi:site-specific DNA-methyltransferase (adenine-specific)
MRDIPDGSVDMVLTDPPYGTTACKWDSVIPFEPMWEQLKRITKPNGAIVLTASQPFTSALIMSNVKMFKYCWVWEKNTVTGFMQAKTKPLKSHEDVLVFGSFKNAAQYFKGTYNHGASSVGGKEYSNKRASDHITGNRSSGVADSAKGYPKSVLNFNSESKTIHPTQKPVALMEYLIRTYTNEGEAVLDFTMGSGTTGVACKNLSRSFIGIEMDADYFKAAAKRIDETPLPIGDLLDA